MTPYFIISCNKGEPAFVRKPNDTNIMEKKPARLECEVIGIPIPVVDWFKDGVYLQNTDNIQIETKNKVLNTLSIKTMGKENSGKYTIKAKNEIGEVEWSFNLRTDGKLFVLIIK